MAILDTLLGPITAIIDKVIPDKEGQAKAKLELLALQGTQDMQMIEAQLQAIVAEANSKDPWTSRARPSFLYVVYILLLTALPMGGAQRLQPGGRARHRRGDECLPQRPARAALRPVRHRLPRLHRRAPVGEGQRGGPVTR